MSKAVWPGQPGVSQKAGTVVALGYAHLPCPEAGIDLLCVSRAPDSGCGGEEAGPGLAARPQQRLPFSSEAS